MQQVFIVEVIILILIIQKYSRLCTVYRSMKFLLSATICRRCGAAVSTQTEKVAKKRKIERVNFPEPLVTS